VPLKPWIQVAAIVLCALCVRAIFLGQLTESPLFHDLAADSADYERLAEKILSGDALDEAFVYQNPLYPFFLAALHKVFGPGTLPVLAVQTGLGAISCALLYAIGRATFGHRIALTAAGLQASYGILIFFSGLLLTTSLVVFLLLAAVSTLLAAQRRQRPGLFLLAGALFGLVMLGRPNALVLLLFLPLAFPFAKRPGQASRSPLVHFGVFLLGTALTLAPAAARNHAINGQFSPFPAIGGLAFYIANNAEATGRLTSPPGVSHAPITQIHTSIALAEQATGASLTPAEASAYWRARGFDYLLSQPVSAFSLYLRKARLFWQAEEIPLNVHYELYRTLTPILRFPWFGFGFIAPLALLGIGIASRRRENPALLLVVVLGYFAAALPFIVSARYRLPVVPFLILYAAYALDAIVSLVRAPRGRVRSLATILASLTALTAAVNSGSRPSDTDRATFDNNLAWVHATSADPRHRDPDRAIALALRAAEQTQFQSADVLDTLAAAYASSGQFDAAIETQLRAIALQPRPSPEMAERLRRYREAVTAAAPADTTR
jgi:4-amino-4-deoxy-L-arabinose transferase-like glycosyltransferase